MMLKSLGPCNLAFLAVLALPSAFAQTTNARLSGTVRDGEGAVIPDATLTVTNLDTNQIHTLRSSASGEYADPSLAPGRYSVAVEHEGFRRVCRPALS